MKILTIDIETIPNLVYSWELYKAYINPEQVVEPSRVICWSGKWLHNERIIFESEQLYGGHEYMIDSAWRHLTEADVVVHYNGESFDVPKLNRAFEKYGLGPPSPYKQVDLLRTVRKVFSFASNKLGFVVHDLDVGEKIANAGWPLWKGCIEGDAESWRLMEEYNRGDVIATEALYKRVLPWIPSIPSFGAFYGTDVCPACGSNNLTRQGHAYTRTGKYQRYQCGDCRKWSRKTRRESGTQITEAAL